MNCMRVCLRFLTMALALFAVTVVCAGLCFDPRAAWALAPEEIMPTPAQEERATALEKGLRCPVCQNQSIHDSEADLARDLRGIVRQKIKDGENDEQIKAWLVERYGAFVLMEPPLQSITLVLWLGPAVFAAVAAFAGAALFRRGKGVQKQ